MAITLHAVDPARHDRAVVFAVDGKYARFALFAATQIAALHPVRDFDIVICSMVEDLAAPPTLAHLGIRFCRVTTGMPSTGCVSIRAEPRRSICGSPFRTPSRRSIGGCSISTPTSSFRAGTCRP